MKIAIYFLSALAGMILHVTSSTAIGAVAEEENSETERIVGGRSAEEGQFPFAAVLFRRDQFICTCSIISPNTVMTAAHCVVRNGVTGPASEFHAIANLRRSSPTVRIDFASVTPHPEYDESNINNDIAIFRTTEPIQFSDTVQPICIARNDTAPTEYRDLIAMGWGDTRRFRIFPVIPDVLQYVDQRLVSNRGCSAAYFGTQLDESKICAGDLLSGICNGDSGGPLIYQGNATNGEPVQLGVASFGNAITGCGFLTPSVWTRVSFYNDFIRSTAAGEEICEI